MSEPDLARIGTSIASIAHAVRGAMPERWEAGHLDATFVSTGTLDVRVHHRRGGRWHGCERPLPSAAVVRIARLGDLMRAAGQEWTGFSLDLGPEGRCSVEFTRADGRHRRR